STITRTHTFDWRNRLSTTKLDGKNWVTVYGYDWANRVIGEETFYDADGNNAYGGADDRRIAQTVTYYDAAGRVYRSVSYEGDTAAGKTTVPDERETGHWYDLAGRAIKTRLPTGLLRKTVYDRLGRTLDEYTSYDDDSLTEYYYPFAFTRWGDIVLEQASYSYDDAGNVTTVARLSRYHDSTVAGDLTAVTTARPSYTSKWYDVLGRLVKTEHRGSENTPADALVTQQSYTMLTGRLFETTDSKGMKTRFFFDNLGRQTRIIRNYVDGQITGGDHGADQTIDLVYGPASTTVHHDPFRVIERWTTDTLGTATKTQKTHYAYGVPKGDAYPNSLITSGKLLYKIGYADPTTGEAHFDPDEPNKAADAPYQETFAYDRQGRLTWRKGQAYSSSNTSDAAT
ncbi:hypothetical protein L0Y59_02040, partial [Candidatus Uhrbacteria bacterium]|nr:hypothetical protein [Candidatus Uhrbacteria bacterium]